MGTKAFVTIRSAHAAPAPLVATAILVSRSLHLPHTDSGSPFRIWPVCEFYGHI